MGIGSIAKTGLNYAGRLIFDDKFSSKVTSSLKGIRRLKTQGKFDGHLGKQIGAAFQKADKVTEKNVWKGLKNSVTSYADDVSKLWKNADKGFFAKLGGTFKGLAKRAPLIGAALTVLFEIPNIYKATRDGGLINGAIETGKSGVRLAAGIAAGAIGSAFLGLPGALAGFFIGDMLGKLVVGKSHSEKLAEAEQKQQEQLAKFGLLQQSYGNEQAAEALANAAGQTPAFQGNMTPQQMQMYQQMLQNGGMNDDFMYQAAFKQGLNQPQIDIQA